MQSNDHIVYILVHNEIWVKRVFHTVWFSVSLMSHLDHHNYWSLGFGDKEKWKSYLIQNPQTWTPFQPIGVTQ